MPSLLHTQDLSIGYGKRLLAQHIQLDIQDRQVVALLGKNGIGKSTFFKTLLRSIPALSGQVFVNGKNIHSLSLKELAQCIAYVPQLHQALPPFSLVDFVMMGRAALIPFLSQPSHKDFLKVDQTLEFLTISHLKHRFVNELSGGEQQLALIARALVQESQLILMDEPTASLDFANQVLVLENILKLKEKGCSIIFSTHHPQQASLMADALLVLADHTIRYLPDAQAFITPENMAQLYQLDPQQVSKYMRFS